MKREISYILFVIKFIPLNLNFYHSGKLIRKSHLNKLIAFLANSGERQKPASSVFFHMRQKRCIVTKNNGS